MTERGNTPDTPQDGENPGGTAQIYDFTSPNRLSGEQIGRLEHLHTSVAKRLSMSLAAQLRRNVDVGVTSIEEANYATFVDSIPSPGMAFTFSAEPLDGLAILEIDLKVLFTLIDRVLGGKGEPIDGLRELTCIEKTVAGRITGELLKDLHQGWNSLGAIKIAAKGFANRSDLIKTYSANTSTVTVEMNVETDNCKGTIRIGYPYPMFEPMLRDGAGQEAAAEAERRDETMTQLMRTVPLEVSARLHSSMVRMGELANLQVGDVLVLDSGADEDVEILAHGKKVFEGRPGKNRNKLAIKVTRVIQDGGSEDDS
jgi:flagellar motor switch protein FliM